MNRAITTGVDPKLLITRSLRRHDLFAPLSDPQWLRLERQMHLHHLAAGHSLFSQGDPAMMFYLVCAGSIKLFRSSPQGLEKIMRLVQSGQSFAESVLFSDPPRYPAHAQAVTASTLVAIDREAYLSTLRESFDACKVVMAQMIEHIYVHRDEVEMLGVHSSQVRVSRYLLGLQAERGDGADGPLRLPSRRTLIAAQLGLAPETLSRALHALRESGLIRSQDGTIEIRDADALRRRARL